MNKQEPVLWVIAGVNGSGKTSYIPWIVKDDKPLFQSPDVGLIHYINPDIMAAKIDLKLAYTPSVQRQASMDVIVLRNHLLDSKKDFSFETTFSGRGEIRFIDKAILKGYQIKLIYLGVNSPMQSILRICGRVDEGGHDVSVESVIRRYDRSIKNLADNIHKFSEAYIIDNSGMVKKRLLSIKNKMIIEITSTPPKWFLDIHKTLRSND